MVQGQAFVFASAYRSGKYENFCGYAGPSASGDARASKLPRCVWLLCICALIRAVGARERKRQVGAVGCFVDFATRIVTLCD